MRLCDDETRNQVFNACILLTQEDALNFIGCLENVLETEASVDEHYHLFDLESREHREIEFLPYEQSDSDAHAWRPRTMLMIKDSAGVLDNLERIDLDGYVDKE